MQPDTVRFRPIEESGKKAEPLGEMRTVEAVPRKPRGEIEDDKGNR